MTAISYARSPAAAAADYRQTRLIWQLLGRSLKYAVLLGASALFVALFQKGIYLPLRLSIVVLYTVFAIGMLTCRFAPFSPLTRLMMVLYTAPFAACVGFLFDDRYRWWRVPLVREYMKDRVTSEIMVMVGLIGLCGLLTGYFFAAHRRRKRDRVVLGSRTLNPMTFAAVLAVAFFFSYINTPPETIMSSVYAAAGGLANRINFNAAFLVAYTLLMLLLIDAEQERQRKGMRTAKRAAVLLTTLFIVVVFQIMRGDRDSFGYLIGIAALFLTEPLPPGTANRIRRRRVSVMFVAGSIVLMSFFAIGDLRRHVATNEHVKLVDALRKGVTEESTSTAVLLTNLSLAHSYRWGLMQVENGHTYLQYLISLPPGSVTYLLGIERPLEIDRGPNFWFSDISAGGVHVVTVPFKNFLAPGAFVVLMLYGYLIARSEVAGKGRGWVVRLWYGSMFVVSAQWFWYGDITFIREGMAFLAVAAMYAFLRRVSAFSFVVHEREEIG